MPGYLLYRFKVHGRVQGVGFRRFVLKLGQQYNIGGWVRNNVDGTVSVEACGKEDEVSNFVEMVRRGSFFSRVDEIEDVLKENTDQEINRVFEIKF